MSTLHVLSSATKSLIRHRRFPTPNTFALAAIADSLNNTLIGGRKRNYYHDDMWNLKYLRKFKWDHLTEKVAYERRVRSQKLRLETMQAKR